MSLTKKEQTFIILATSIGSAVEWYELFLYVYWAPLISKMYFCADGDFVGSMKTLFVFFIGFLARPIGGLIFGHMGDKLGRKISFARSIILMTIPSFAMGLIPNQIGIFAPIILCILRFLQGLPAGGELPGAMCYLAECAPPKRRSLVCSFTFFGPQIGVIISMLECYFLHKYMSEKALFSWGWRLSFIIGGLFGLIGFYLRHKLKESPAFHNLVNSKKVLHHPIKEAIFRHKKDIISGFFVSFLDVIGFYLFSIFLGIYFYKIIKISPSENLLIAAGLMIFSTLTLPLLGMLGDKFKSKNLLMLSSLGMIIFAVPFYFSASHGSVMYTTIFEIILVLLLNVQYAILPCLIAELFPTSTRYTGIGMSFNFADSLIGGITPVLALFLTSLIGDIATFVLLICIGAIVTSVALFFIKERRLHTINVDPV